MNYDSTEFSNVRHDLKNSIRRIDLISERIDEFIDDDTPIEDRVIRDMEVEVKKISGLWNKYKNFITSNIVN